MKSPDEILAEANKKIAHMHNRPFMYVASADRVRAGEVFDGMMWVAHWFWSVIQSREQEFRETSGDVRKAHGCGPFPFADVLRRQHPHVDEQMVFERVREFWAEVDAKLGIDISEEAAKP